MDNTKYIGLDTNLIKLKHKENALRTLEDPNFYFFCGHSNLEINKAKRLHRKVISRTKKRLKRILVVIEKQKLQANDNI